MPSKSGADDRKHAKASATTVARARDIPKDNPADDRAGRFTRQALQDAIFNSANFSSIATDADGVIQIFNVGAEKMLGYTAAEVMNKITPAEISDTQEIVVRADALSIEFETVIAPGFEALVYKAVRGIEDIYELTYIRKDGSRLPAVVSVTALRDDEGVIIGYLLIGTDNTARKIAEEAQTRLDRELRAITNCGQAVLRAKDEQTLIGEVSRIVCDEAGYRMAWVGYVEHDAAKTVRPVAHAGFEDGYLAAAHITWADTEHGRGPTGIAVRSGEIAVLQDFATDASAVPWREEASNRGFRSSIVLPLKDRHETFGVMNIYSTERDAFTLEEIRLLGEMADDLAFGVSMLRTRAARKQAEDALARAGTLQTAIFNSANFSSIATDANGVIQIFNVGAEKMLGYTAADVTDAVTPAEISDPQEIIARAEALSFEFETPIAPGFEALVYKAARSIEDIYELTYIRKDGSRFPAVVSVTALRDEEGAIIGYLLIGTDNTVRKQIESERTKLDQSLRDLQFYTRSLIEANLDPIVTTDPQGIITDVNKQMEALTGCTRDELIGAPIKGHFTDPARAEASIRRVLVEGRITDYELTARARDGTETVVSYNATTFHDRDRRLLGVFAGARDITERKRLDEVLEEKNAELECAKIVAEDANRAKSDFLSGMSHELRSPLNAILGFAQLMESETQAPSPSQKESIEQILHAGWHLLALINEVLDLAKVESGKVTLAMESVSVAEVMSECESMVAGQARDRGIRMRFPAFETPLYVHADRTRLKQIILNLLSNAIKYNRDDGAVDVLCVPGSDGRVLISIRDTGAGLAPEKIAQLFQPFNRLGQEAGQQEGTGIGLVVAKQLVELMGGVIGVESVPGTGSEFWFEMVAGAVPQDLTEEDEAASSERTPARTGTRPGVVLYVEDNPVNLKLVEQLIARRPELELLSAATGYLGLELARAHRPDLILMDINLPDISGIEVLARLRADPTTTTIPVVAISANAMPQDIKRGLHAGFLRYLAKPIIVAQFMEMLDTVLSATDMATRSEEDAGSNP